MGRRYGYARALSTDQRAQSQVDALKKAGCARVFVDGLSRSIDRRPEFERLLSRLRPGDTVVVLRLDRLALSVRALAERLQELDAHGIGFRSLTEPLNMTGADRTTVLGVVAALASFERDLMQRTDGVPTAGRTPGEPGTGADGGGGPRQRPAAPSPPDPQARAAERWQILRYHVEEGVTLAALARETGLAYRTLQRWDARYRSGGVAALDDRQRADAGTRRLPATLVAAIEALASSHLGPTVTSIHRRIVARCVAEGMPPPSYSAVRSIARAAGRSPRQPPGRGKPVGHDSTTASVSE
ncbi:MAG TPA: recombinase family protein [Trebonia sp.]|nr:recombinase family protein [Trebonia sp.]